MRLVDTHIHLYSGEYRGDIDKILSKSWESCVEAIICVSEDYETALETIGIASKYDLVYPAIGMHPWTALHSYNELEDIAKVIEENIDDIVAVGEVGLDRKYECGEKGWKRQLKTFERMIELACEYGKPLNIHSRRAARDVLRLLHVYNVEKAHFHWFTDEEEILREIVSEGYYVSFTPSITYSKRNQRLAKLVPPEQLLTETDGPISYYGELKNMLTEPKHVNLVLKKLSEIHGMDEEELADIIWSNFRKLYKV